MSRPTHLVVSPHLDDAVFSCPAWMLRSIRSGADVHVATIFTSAGPRPAQPDLTLYARRCEEDEAALALLGAHPIHAGLPDAPYRSSRYQAFVGLVCADADPHDPAPALVAARIEALIAELHPASIHALLAVGSHIDHRIVFDAIRAAQARHRDIAVSFAEDRPYSLVRGAVAIRLGMLGFTHPACPPPAAGERWTADLLRAQYVRAHVSPNTRPAVAAHARAQWELASRSAVSNALTLEQVPWLEHDAHLALQAMACYASQWPAFYGSIGAARSSLGLPGRPRRQRSWQLPITRLGA